MSRLLPALVFLMLSACGLAEDPRDEENKYVYITFSDKQFEAYCLGAFDLSDDGRLSRYEAQRVREIDCRDRNIASLWEIGEFTRLETLDCDGNAISELDLRKCTLLKQVDCSRNELTSLDVRGLRGLVTLNCADNALSVLDLTSNVSIAQFDCRTNRFTTLDLSNCAAALRADVRSNPILTTVYSRTGQGVTHDGNTSVVVQ